MKQVSFGDKEYPRYLKEIVDFPKSIYVEGDISRIHPDRLVSVVGTRRPSDYGKVAANKIGTDLGRVGISVVSGLAFGIDRISQLACARAGTTTVGVLGEGISLWQERNKALFERFRGKLILVSEYPPMKPAAKHTFPQRNRIIAGLSMKTVVVEAVARSGALITGELANQYDRDVYAIPHRIDTDQGVGGNNLIWKNKARIFRKISDLYDEMYLEEISDSSISDSLRGTEKKLYKLIKGKPNLFSYQIADMLNVSFEDIQPSLTKLETKGILTKSIEGRYSKSLR